MSEEEADGGLTAVSIRRSVTTAMAFLALAGFGLFSLFNLPLNRLPEVELPVIAVVCTYQGASPQDMETLVTEPIERAVASVGNIERIRSTSRQGTSVTLVSFVWGTDMSAAEVEVRKNLEIFAGELLPSDATRPLTFAFDPSLAPVVFLSMEGNLDAHQLRTAAEDWAQPYLGRLDGVAAAEVMGGLDRQIHVLMKMRRMQALGISPAQVVDALRAANVVIPSGAVDDGVQRMNLQPTGLYQSIDEIRNTVVTYRGDRPVLVGEIAEVIDGFEEETHIVTANGERAVLLAVRKQSDANTVEVARNVERSLPGIQERLPDGVTITKLFDESTSILRSIENLGITGLQAFLLTGLVLLIFLRSWRTSLIAVIAVPSSILVAFSMMVTLDVTLNLISLAGLALAIGLLVDNGIVVLEATFQYVEKGESPRRAALLGAKEMGLPLFASTLTTVIVFLPILLVEGIASELFRDLIITITTALLASLLVALSLVPLMASRLVGRDHQSRFAAILRRLTGGLDRIGPAYARVLGWALVRRRRVIGGALLLFVVSLGILPLLGQDFMPKADVSQIRMELTAAPGTSIEEMKVLVSEVESAIRDSVPEAVVVTTDFGASEGVSALFGATANRGTIQVKLPPPRMRQRTQQEIESVIAGLFDDVAPGLDLRIASFSFSSDGGDITLKLFSEDLDKLREQGERFRSELGAIEGVRDARFSMVQGSPELQLSYERDRMRELGIAPAQVASAVSIFYQGETATFYRDEGDEHLVRVRAPREQRADLDILRYLPIPLPQPEGELAALAETRFIPLSAVASVDDQLGPTDIEHEDQRRFATVDLSVEASNLGGVVREVEQRIARMGMPQGMQFEIGGTAEDLRDAFFKLAMALLAALCLVYMVMASQFESLFEPFVIMFTVPLASIGVVLGLLFTGTTLQVTALVGVILLGGVVVNNGIVLIDVLKRRHREGHDLIEAALEAGRTRVRPILMTALTTILGMIPLSLGLGDGAEIWAPMARAVIGGMIVSTALTLVVIPVLYVSLRGRLDRRHQTVTREEPGGEPDIDAQAEEPAPSLDAVARERAPATD